MATTTGPDALKLHITGLIHVFHAPVDTTVPDISTFDFSDVMSTGSFGDWTWLGDTSSENLIELASDGGDAEYKRTADRLKVRAVREDTTYTLTINTVGEISAPASIKGARVCVISQSGFNHPAAVANAIDAAITPTTSTNPMNTEETVFFHRPFAKDSCPSPTALVHFSKVINRQTITVAISGVNMRSEIGRIANGCAKPRVLKRTASSA